MKSVANRLIMLAAGAVVIAAAVYGQTEMTARIPFAFSAQGNSLPAGSYRVYNDTTHGGTNFVRLSNVDTNQTVVTMSNPAEYGKSGEAPRMVFRCGDGGCALNQIWTRSAGYKYPIQNHKAKERLASIPLREASGD